MPHRVIYLANPLCKIAIVMLAMAGSSCAVATNDSGCDGSAACNLASANQRGVEEQILTLVNAERANAGCQPLSFSCELTNAAHQHNLRMASSGFFDHRGGGEAGLFDRLIAAGTAVESAGENLFMMSNSSDSLANQCVTSWMNSDGHRRNLLSPEFDSTGISVLHSKDEFYVTEDFARIGTSTHLARRSHTSSKRLAAHHTRRRNAHRLAAAEISRASHSRHRARTKVALAI